MANDIPLSLPMVTRDDLAALGDALAAGRLTAGPCVAQLETALATATGQDLCLTTATYVQAISMALSAQGIGQGAQVLIPALGDPAIAVGVLQVGAQVVPVDCCPSTLVIDAEAIARSITPSTRAVLAGGVDGSAASLDRVAAASRAAEVSLIEIVGPDLGAHIDGSPRGALGHVAVVDLTAHGHVGGGAGGAIVTSDGRLHDTATAITAGWFEQPVAPGPCAMPESIAALAVAQLQRLDRAIRHCTSLADHYTRLLSGQSSLMLPTTDGQGTSSWAAYLVRLDEHFTAQGRDEIIAGMRRHDLLASSGPIDMAHRLGVATCPVASSIAQRTIALPIHAGLTERDVDLVCQTLDLMIQRAVFRNDPS